MELISKIFLTFSKIIKIYTYSHNTEATCLVTSRGFSDCHTRLPFATPFAPADIASFAIFAVALSPSLADFGPPATIIRTETNLLPDEMLQHFHSN